MTHEVYLKHTQTLIIGIRGPRFWGELHEHHFAHIMYCPEKGDTNGNKIGDLVWIMYKQELAIENGINMTHVPDLYIRRDFETLLDLDYTHISQETIDEIGAASHPNIVILLDISISASFRNKGIGKEALKRFLEQMKDKCGYVIITKNEPAQFNKYKKLGCPSTIKSMKYDSLEKDYEKAQYQLNAFWQRCGFKQFKNYDNVFICNVDKAVPDYNEVAHTAGQLT
jgi:predicted acetyltransferase